MGISSKHHQAVNILQINLGMGALAQGATSDQRIGTRSRLADLAAAIQGPEAAVQGLYLVLRDCEWQEIPCVSVSLLQAPCDIAQRSGHNTFSCKSTSK
jgi:hypothetical protein